MTTPLSESHDTLAWGRAHRFTHHVARPAFADQLADVLAARGGRSLLARGMGRSYGDSGLNADNILIDTRALDHLITFDETTGELEAEAGLSLRSLIALLLARGARWFLPVTPGTKFVSLGGAIASDVHGKNHHGAGCFGNHVRSLRLLRSDGRIVTCSPTENGELFRATIGGLGLTGLIVSVRIALKPVPGAWLENEDIRYDNLDAFYALTAESLADWEYTVAWVDCTARGRDVGRGVFSRARHVAARTKGPPLHDPRVSLPMALPNSALNRATLHAFNAAYWRRAPRKPARKVVSFEKVFYPLDVIGGWNLLYGRRGFFQYQCVVPTARQEGTVRALLTEIATSGIGSFLAVLKTLGDRASPGLLSFPMPGTTLALDFPNDGARTLALLERLDTITHGAGGRIYAAKDGRVSAANFRAGYPGWQTFARHVDPVFSSSFWRRVGGSA